jgi:hypothetical protein
MRRWRRSSTYRLPTVPHVCRFFRTTACKHGACNAHWRVAPHTAPCGQAYKLSRVLSNSESPESSPVKMATRHVAAHCNPNPNPACHCIRRHSSEPEEEAPVLTLLLTILRFVVSCVSGHP